MEKACPICECEMEQWNQGIYECPECGNTFDDGDVLEDFKDF